MVLILDVEILALLVLTELAGGSRDVEGKQQQEEDEDRDDGPEHQDVLASVLEVGEQLGNLGVHPSGKAEDADDQAEDQEGGESSDDVQVASPEEPRGVVLGGGGLDLAFLSVELLHCWELGN